MTDVLIVSVLVIVLIIGLARSLKIAGESERFAVFSMGRFLAFKGPGLVFVIPDVQRVHRLRIGDIGTLAGPQFARFGDVDIPVGDIGSLRPGDDVRIDGFDGVEPKLTASSVRAKSICPRCGHAF